MNAFGVKIKRYSHSCPSSDALGRFPFHDPLCDGEPGALDADADAHSLPDCPILGVDKFLPQKADLNKE